MSKFLIYALIDPRSYEVRYIGKSHSGLNRPRQHVMPSFLKGQTYKERWARALLADDLQPIIMVIERFPSSVGLAEAECYWIAQARALGWRLTNLTSGGDGVPMVRTAEHNAKIGKALKGRVVPDAQRLNMSVAAKSRSLDSNVMAERAAAMWAKPRAHEDASKRMAAQWDDPAIREHFIQTRRGRKQSSETKNKRSLIFRSLWQDPGYREKVLSARRGKKLSPAHRLKLSAAAKLREERKRNARG